jgi:hypothetical protein
MIKKDMTVKDFIDLLMSYRIEFAESGAVVHSHATIPTTVRFVDLNGDGMDMELGIDTMSGCGCWTGLVFRQKRTSAD